MDEASPLSQPWSNHEGFDWLARESRWIEQSSTVHFGVGPIYIICMESRLDHVSDFLECNQLQGAVSILRAFTPEDLDIGYLTDKGVVDREFFTKRSAERGFDFEMARRELCCFLGHIACWLEAHNSGVDSALFLEDDLTAAADRERANRLMTLAADHSWDLFYFSYCFADQQRSRLITKDLVELKGQLCANAYALRPLVSRLLLRRVFPIQMASDEYMEQQAEVEGLRALGAREQLFEQDRENIVSSFESRRFAFLPAWKPSSLQRVLARFYSILTGSGQQGYLHGQYLIDRHRQGKLSEKESRWALIRTYDWLRRLTGFPHDAFPPEVDDAASEAVSVDEEALHR